MYKKLRIRSWEAERLPRCNYIQRTLSGDSANAVPHYQKLRVRVTHIWGNRRGQPNRSAMARPHPRGTTFLIMVNLHAR
jgi:hypothetical protein